MRKIYFLCMLLCTMSLSTMQAGINARKPGNPLILLNSENRELFRLQTIPDEFSDAATGRTLKSDRNLSPQQLQANTIVLLDSILSESGEGAKLSKSVYGYDVNGKQVLSESYRWNSTESLWEGSTKIVRNFNSNGDVTLYERYSWATGLWTCEYRELTEWGMDEANNKTMILTQYQLDYETQILSPVYKREATFQGDESNVYKYLTEYMWTPENTWQPTSKEVQLLNDDGYEVTSASYIWNTETNSFEGTNKSGYSYAADQSYRILSAFYIWNPELHDWTNKIEEEYNADGATIARTEYLKNEDAWQAVSKTGYDGDYTVYYELTGNTFTPTYKEVTYYDENNNLSFYSRYDWDVEYERWYLSDQISLCAWDNLSGSWKIYQKIELGYNRFGNQLYRIQLARSNSLSPWVANMTYKWEYTYDENNNPLTYHVYNLTEDEQGNVIWTNRSKREHSYNNQGNTSLIIYFNWDGANWVETQKSYYFYSEHVISGEVPAYSAQLKTYPNPVKSTLTVSGTKANDIIRILDLDGRQVSVYKTESDKTDIDFSNMPEGIYLVNIDGASMKIVKN